LPERLGLDHDAAKLPFFEGALRLHRTQKLLAVEMPIAEVPSEHHAGNDFAVQPLVLAEIRQGFGNELRKCAAVQLHEPKRHHLASDADAKRSVVEELELVVDPRRALGQLVELAITVLTKEPNAVSPVARVVAHRQKERHLRGEQVSEE